DLSAVPGSGAGGRILASDVETFVRREGASAEGRPAAKQPPARDDSGLPTLDSGLSDRRVPLRGVRRRIAQTMSQAWSTIPHITGFDEVEVSALVEARDRLRPVAEARGQRLTYLPFVIKAVTVALREFPIVNASLDEAAGEIVYHAVAHVGIAT